MIQLETWRQIKSFLLVIIVSCIPWVAAASAVYRESMDIMQFEFGIRLELSRLIHKESVSLVTH